MALRFAALLLLVAVSVASAQRFTKHETIRALPESCQQGGSSDWSSQQPYGSSSSRGRSSTGRVSGGGDVSTVGPCKLLPPMHEGEGYEYCLKCKAGEKNGVTAEELAQSIRQVVERKLKRNQQFTRGGAKLNIVIDGVKQPIDLTRVLANTPEVLEKVDDVFFFFPNGQIGRIEFEHGQPDDLERITCRAPCAGGPKQGSAGQSSWSSSSRHQPNDIDEDEEQEENVYSSSSSSRYLSDKNKNKNKKYPAGAYSYGETTTPSYGSRSASNRQHFYGQSSTGYGRSGASANAGRYGDNQRRSGNAHAEEEEDDK